MAPLYPVAAVVAVVVAVVLALAVLVALLAAARWRLFLACPSPFWLVVAVAAGYLAGALAGVVVGPAGAVAAGAAVPRVGMGHPALCKVMDRAAEFVAVVGFPARFELASGLCLLVVVVALARLALLV